jgi:hypothetical protein
MLTQLDLIKAELEGDEAGVEPDLSKIGAQLLDFLIKEAGEDIDECITFINSVITKLDKYEEKEEKEMKITQSDAPEGRPEEEALTPEEGGGTSPASKTQGLLSGAPEASPAEGATKETNTTMEGGDKEGAQSVSMAQGE